MPIPVGFCQLKYVISLAGKPATMSYSIGAKQTGGTPTAADYALSGYQAMTANDCPWATNVNQSAKFALEGCEATLMTPSGPIPAFSGPRKTGTVANEEPVPINSSVLVRKNTTLGGRKGRGRLFVPPWFPAEISVDALGNIESTSLAGLQTSWTALIGSFATLDLVPFLFHSDATAPTQITSFTVQGLLATQRRRMR